MVWIENSEEKEETVGMTIHGIEWLKNAEWLARLDQECAKDMRRADRRRAVRAVRESGLREVPRAVQRATLYGEEIIRPLVDGKTPSLCACASRTFMLRALVSVQRLGLVNVPRTSLLKKMRDKVITRPLVDGKTPSLRAGVFAAVSRRAMKRRAHGIDRKFTRKWLASIGADEGHEADSIAEEVANELEKMAKPFGETDWATRLINARKPVTVAASVLRAPQRAGIPSKLVLTMHKYADPKMRFRRAH